MSIGIGSRPEDWREGARLKTAELLGIDLGDFPLPGELDAAIAAENGDVSLLLQDMLDAHEAWQRALESGANEGERLSRRGRFESFRTALIASIRK